MLSVGLLPNEQALADSAASLYVLEFVEVEGLQPGRCAAGPPRHCWFEVCCTDRTVAAFESPCWPLFLPKLQQCPPDAC